MPVDPSGVIGALNQLQQANATQANWNFRAKQMQAQRFGQMTGLLGMGAGAVVGGVPGAMVGGALGQSVGTAFAPSGGGQPMDPMQVASLGLQAYQLKQQSDQRQAASTYVQNYGNLYGPQMQGPGPENYGTIKGSLTGSETPEGYGALAPPQEAPPPNPQDAAKTQAFGALQRMAAAGADPKEVMALAGAIAPMPMMEKLSAGDALIATVRHPDGTVSTRQVARASFKPEKLAPGEQAIDPQTGQVIAQAPYKPEYLSVPPANAVLKVDPNAPLGSMAGVPPVGGVLSAPAAGGSLNAPLPNGRIAGTLDSTPTAMPVSAPPTAASAAPVPPPQVAPGVTTLKGSVMPKLVPESDWNNYPTLKTLPRGKGIQVTLGADGKPTFFDPRQDYTVSAGIRAEQNDRALYMASRRSYDAAQPYASNLKALIGKGLANFKSGDDYSLAYNVQSLINTRSEVGEGEAASIRGVGSLPQRVQAQISRAMNGETLTVPQRETLMEVGARHYKGLYDANSQNYNEFSARAKKNGWDALPKMDVVKPEDLFTGIGATASTAKPQPEQRIRGVPVAPTRERLERLYGVKLE